MKALTVRSPWAEMIAMGIKDVENRSWRTNYRGPLAIHCAKGRRRQEWSADLEICEQLINDWDRWVEVDQELANVGDVFANVIAIVELVDCVRDSNSRWAMPDQWHWILRDARGIEQEPVKGKLGLWEWAKP